ncbi:MAG: hypothetical protein J7525_14120 [Roseofilum sp. SID3]|uniref:hypothetical protein n=1 Tax=Roseofilum sp. SID3 TaxID=2821499 RepID=UPI001B1B302B|nr:hypothetical protein [Roseofilum sp. SID3]MBP0014229.1 hypothetical protein [Roseofilum sp. SID3]
MSKFFIPLFILFLVVGFSTSAIASSITIYEASCSQEEEGDWRLVPESWRSKFPFSLLYYQTVADDAECFYMFNNFAEYPELFAGAPCLTPPVKFFNTLAAFSFTIASIKGFSK